MDIYYAGKVIRSYKLSNISAKTACSFSWDGKNKSGVYVKSGTYHAKIHAVDLAGNKSHTASRTILLRDYTKPLVTVPRSLDYDYYKGGTASIAVKLSEPAYVTAKVYDSYGDYVYTIANHKGMKAGTNTIRFNGKDNHGKRIPPYLYALEVRFTAVDANGNKISGYESTLIGGDGEEG
jgi:flagellar hook assembly protein FlgD